MTKKYKIDRELYKMNSGFIKTEIKKNKIILCGSGRKSNYELINNQNTIYNKAYPTYTITRKGIIYEHYDPKYYSNYLQDENLNESSIFISLENMGGLYYSEENQIYYNLLNEIYEEKKIPLNKSWRKFIYFESYTKEQLNATIFLCKLLCLELNINDDTIGHNVYSDDAYYYNGIITKANLNKEYLDLNPSFDFKYFIKELKN